MISDIEKTVQFYKQALAGSTNSAIRDILDNWDNWTEGQCKLLENEYKKMTDTTQLITTLKDNNAFGNSVLKSLVEFYDQTGFLTSKQMKMGKDIIDEQVMAKDFYEKIHLLDKLETEHPVLYGMSKQYTTKGYLTRKQLIFGNNLLEQATQVSNGSSP